MLLKFAKATTDPNIAAALVEKAADLKSQVDDSSAPDPTPLAPDVEPSAKQDPTKEKRPQCCGGAVKPFEDATGGAGPGMVEYRSRNDCWVPAWVDRERHLHGGSAVSDRHPTFQSEELTADFCLGVAIAGVNTLIGIALIIAFA
jgi:hypothetical protein